MKRLLLVLCLSLTACAGNLTPKVRIDRADRIAFESVRAFQTAETASFHACAAPCPWEATHRTINGKVSDAYTLIIDVANLGLSLVPGQAMPANVIAELALLTKTVADIVALVPTQAGATAKTNATTAQQKTAVLVDTIQNGGR